MQQFREQLVLSIGTKLAVFVYHSQVLSGAGHRQKLRKFIEILETFGGKAMWQRNNGQAEDDLQFRFTAYLVSAVKRRRKDYLIQLYKRSSIESTVEVVYESEPSSEEVVLDKLPLMDVIENGALLEALQKLNERERQIFLARTLEEEDFETLGVKFELSYKGAAALYYRTIQKIRKSIEGGDKRCLLLSAKAGNEDAITTILQMYRPLLLKYAIIDGVLDEDLYQELSIILLKAIKLFKI